MSASKHIKEHIALGIGNPLSIASVNRNGQRMALLGDSILNQIYIQSNQYSWKGIPLLANAMLGCPFEFVDAAVSSETTTQILARVPADVLAHNVGWCLVYAGLNDLTNGNLVASAPTGSQITKEGIVTNLLAMYKMMLAAGIKIITATIYPVTSLDDETAGGNLQRDALGHVNEWIRRWSANRTNVYCVDFEKAMTDVTTNLAKSTLVYDQTHTSILGAQQCSRSLYDILYDIVPPGVFSSSWGLDPKNLIGPIGNTGKGSGATGSNGVVLGAGLSGTFPYGWCASVRNTGTGVCSVSTGTDVNRTAYGKVVASFAANYDGIWVKIGGSDVAATGRRDTRWVANTAYTYNAKVKRSTGAGGDNGYIYYVLTPGTSHATTEPTWPTQEGTITTDGTVKWLCTRVPLTGEELYAQCQILLSGLSASGNACVKLSLNHINTSSAIDSSSVYGAFDLTGADGDPHDWIPTAPIILRTPSMVMPASTTRYIFAEVFIGGLAGDSITVEIANVGIYNKTNGSQLA